MTATRPDGMPVELPFRRILFVGTGSINVSGMPHWVSWLRGSYPDVEVRAGLTRSARRFVAPDALAVLSGRPLWFDDWDEHPSHATPHLEAATWPDAIIVHPASFHFVSRLALGLTDTPLQLALQGTDALVGIAPCVPARAVDSPVLQQHLATIAARPGFVVAPFHTGYSAATREPSPGVSLPLPGVVALLAEAHGKRAGGPSGADGTGTTGAGVGDGTGTTAVDDRTGTTGAGGGTGA